MKPTFSAMFGIAAVIFIHISLQSFAQQERGKLSGSITDTESGNPISGAAVYIPDLKTGTITDLNGKYFISNLPSKKIFMQVTMVGYKTILENIDLSVITQKDFQLIEAVKEINEVIITGSTNVVERNKSATPVSIINKSVLVENSSSNIIDALTSQPGISQITTGPGISKPVIRGLGYNRVVVVNDGIKQEGQQWGDEHGIEIDENSIYKVEILKGPASLSYGSDAIAGVINMISAPTLQEGKIQGNVSANYRSNNGQLGYTLNLSGNRKGWIFDLRYSNKVAHDYKNKTDGSVYNSRFREDAINGIAGLNRSWGYVHLHLSSYNFSPGIIEGERDSVTGKFTKQILVNDSTVSNEIVSENDFTLYDPAVPFQKINHTKAVLNSSVIIKNGTLKTILGFQQNKRKEFAEIISPDEYGLYFLLNTINYEVRYIFPEMKGFNIATGINGMSQKSINKGSEFLVPAYDLFDAGIFIIASKSINKFDISGGLRYDNRIQNADELYVDESGIPVDKTAPGSLARFNAFDVNNSGFSGSIGTTYQFSNSMYGKINFAAGFRSPNIAELGSNGIHEGTFRYEIGNSELSAERSYQADLAFGINTNHVTAELDLFDNTINDFIFLSAISNSMGGDSTIDGYSAFKYVAGQAEIRGGEFLIDIHPHPLDWLHFENSISMVSAIQKNQTDSTKHLPNTPGTKITTDFRFTSKKLFGILLNSYLKIGINNFLKQDNVYSAYNTETPTPGYTLIIAGIGTEIKIKNKINMRLQINVNNLSDVSYQNHLSRLKYAPENYATGNNGVFNEGRSINIRMELGF